MEIREKIDIFRQMIHNQIFPLLDSHHCILIGTPFYQNIGDILIWEGLKNFINDNGIKCQKSFSIYQSPDSLSPKSDVMLFCTGGGAINDIWSHTEYFINFAKYYPNNQIVIFPQTVYFSNSEKEKNCFEILRRHKNLIFCARDIRSFEVACKYLEKRSVLLLPDIAFYISPITIKKWILQVTKDTLYIKRKDEEKGKDIQITGNAEVSDWPPYETPSYTVHINNLFYRTHFYNFPMKTLFYHIWNEYYKIWFHKTMICEGVRFISPYKHIYTNRLHGAILAMLLNKQVTIIDNNYGKNSSFYHTWLNDINSINLITP